MRKFSGYGPSVMVLLTAAVVLFVGPSAVQRLTYENTRTRIIQARHNLEGGEIGGVLERMNQAYRDIATIVEPSVVHVSAQYAERDAMGREFTGVSTGSGWIFDEDGHVITNHHVVVNAERIDVQLYNGKTRPAMLIGADTSTDIAVLKIDPGMLHPAQLADLDQPVRQGDLVFAFGSPFDFRFSMSSGVVSGKDRSVGVLRDETGRRLGYENFIQVDAAINPGNSGGPLTDYRGHVIGMNTAIATGRRAAVDEGQFSGIGLAIPLDMIYPAVTQLIQNGFVEKGYLGVSVPQTNEENESRLATLGFNGTGVVMTDVQAREAAAVAGVQRNDVVTHINDRPVGSVAQLQSIISSMLPGGTAKLSIWRRDRERQTSQLLEINVPLAKLNMLRATGRLDSNQPKDSLIGLGISRMATSTPLLAQEISVEHRSGVLVQEVVPGSRLSRTIGPGATIVAVNEVAIRDVDELLAVLRFIDLSRVGAQAEVYDAGGRRLMLLLRAE